MKKTKMKKKNYEYKQVLTKGKYYTGKYIEAFIQSNKKENTNKLGIAISAKIAKAVKRNKIKRLIRENYYIQENNIKTGYAIVFLWKKKQDTKNATFYNIQKDIKQIFEKAKIIEEKT